MKTRLQTIVLIFIISFISTNDLQTYAQEKRNPSTEFSEQQKKISALEHAKQGQKYLKQKNWEQATAEFEQALKLQPQSSIFHNLLGISYLENSQADRAWGEFRKAVLLDPNNKRAIRDFMEIWNFFDKKGLLNVGTPESTILKVLGQPDRKRDQKGESQLSYGFMWIHVRNGRLFALVDTRALALDLIKALNTMEYRLPPDWRAGYRAMNAYNALTEYITGEETVQNYQQRFSTQRLLKMGEKLSAREMMIRTKAVLEKMHQIEEWNVIQDGENDILFEWFTAKNEKSPARYEISRLVRGNRDMHRLAYVNQRPPLTEESRAEWIKILRAAKLVVAHPKKPNLTDAQKKDLEDKLTIKSREIIALQLKYIQNLDVNSMKPFFTQRLRSLISTDLLEKSKQQAISAKPEELVHAVQIEISGDQIQAKIKMKNGRTLTTLIPVNGKWEADTIWFK